MKEIKKQRQFELAKELRLGGLSFSKIGRIVAEIAGRKKPYSSSTICGWSKFENYTVYCDDARRKQAAIIARKKGFVATSSSPELENFVTQLRSIEENLADAYNSIRSLVNAIK